MSQKSLYFFALTVDAPFKEEVCQLQQEMCSKYDVCKSLNSPPHITLVAPFWAQAEQEKTLQEICASRTLTDSTGKTIGFNHFDDRVIYIQPEYKEEWGVMRMDLHITIIEYGLDLSYKKPFHPHITIGHRNLRPHFKEAWKYFSQFEVTDQFNLSGPKLLKHDGQKWEECE